MHDLYAKADELYDNRQFTEAFELFMAIAESDSPDKGSAMDRIASMYDAGEGVDYDFDKAIFWYKKALEHGNTSTSLHNLGVTYRARGDIVDAREWFKASLDSGNNNSALDIAKIYMVCDNHRDKVIYYLKRCLEGEDSLYEDVYLEATELLTSMNDSSDKPF